MSAEDVRANYSQVGNELIEKLYGNGYLSIGGTRSTDILAAEAGVTRESRILDVGSGLGGPALHLAESHGCRVTGLDLVDLSVSEGNRRAEARGLDHLVDFRVGDATEMPFESGRFDVVLGQDAWCHVPDKDRLIGECARVLTPNGTLAFTDWLRVGEMDDDFRAQLLSATASSNLASLQSYCTLLEKRGFSILTRQDISDGFLDRYREIIARLRGLEAEISGKFGPKVFRIMLEKNGCILRAFEGEMIGGGRIVAGRR